MSNDLRPIGIFDSGVGGLTVYREIRSALPQEDILYLGDTARVPYGIRSPQTVLKYATANTNFLKQQNIKLLIIACNTASAVAMQTLSKIYHDIPIIDVVQPGARRAAAVTRNRRIGVIGTEATIRSSAYEQAIQHIDHTIKVFGRACPLFVPLAEEGWYSCDDPIAMLTAQRYLAFFHGMDIDTLVLGCTHYPILKEVIQATLGEKIELVDSAEETARETVAVLEHFGLRRRNGTGGADTFFVTDVPTRFIETGSRFLGRELRNVHLVDIL